MNNVFGNKFRILLHGASHSKDLGVFIFGAPLDYRVDIDGLKAEIERRKPNNKWTTPRKEKDEPKVEYLSGVISISFTNNNINDNDYNKFVDTPRPSHADYVQHNKYKDAKTLLGGGIASGRMTLPIVAAGFVAKELLKTYEADIDIKADIVSIGDITEKDVQTKILDWCYENGDSVGAKVRCTVKNPPKFIGEPFFDSVESIISHGIFSIPGVKAISFGDGIDCIYKYGSQRNDLYIDNEGHTSSNNEGGINGGITNGNDIVFDVYVKPTASISKPQETWNFKEDKQETLEIGGRHDICFALRTPVVIEAITAISLLDLCKEQ